jgi:hypothetical protein
LVEDVWKLFTASENRPGFDGFAIALVLVGFIRRFWSGRPGSNRRRPAWEFSLENDVFYFCSNNLAYLFRSKNLFSDLSNFNWFQAFYFWLGHVLGMRLPTRPTLKLWQLSKIELGQVVGLQDQR